MLAALTFLPRLLIDKTARVLRRRRLDWDRKRIDRLYGPLTPRCVAAQLDASAQAGRLSETVRLHCQVGTSIMDAHRGAAIRVDSAEYAFSSLLDELRGVMTKMPTEWAPDRTRYDGVSDFAPFGQTGVNARAA